MAIWEWLFPKRCFGCKVWGEYVCAGCVNRIRVMDNQICPICNRGSAGGMTHPRCRGQDQMDGLTAVLAYSGLTKRLIKAFKYQWVETLANDLMELIISLGDWRMVAGQKWVVTAIPLHPQRERWRGFNQAEVIAKAVAAYGRWKYQGGVLIRTRKTKPQMSLKRQEREENMTGAFGAGQELSRVKGKPVLLVDDVWTTGATLREAAKVLKRAGAIKVWGFTLARAV